MIEVNQLETEAAVELWPDLAPYVSRALAFDPFESITLERIADQVATGYARLLVAVKDQQILGATVVQMFKKNDERVLHVLTTAGVDLEQWLPALIDELVTLAEEHSSAVITMSGRPGWSKTLRPFGFKTAHVQMRLEVEHGLSRQVGKLTAVTEH